MDKPILPQPEPRPEISLKLDLKTAQALKTIYSPTHDPKIDRKSDRRAEVKLDLKPQELARENKFVLYFSQDNGALTMNSLNYQRPGEDGYFLMTLRAPDNLKTEVLPKDVVLVIDTSGSMGGDKIRQAKEALKAIINRLRPEDRFGLLQFNTDVSTFQSELTPASAANKRAALDYVDTLGASGSTNIEAALQSGFAQLKNHDPKRPAYVIFLTDGEPTVGITDTAGLMKVAEAANADDAKLFSFGVGYNLNTLLLNKLSEENHGSTTFVEPNENLELAMTGFYQKIESPVLTDARLTFDGIQVGKMYPERIGDLFAGSEVIVLGRYTGGGQGTATLSGKVGTETRSYHLPVHWRESTAHGQLPRLWAGRRVAYLLENIRLNGENPELKDEVVALGKQYGLVTPYTSYISVEDEADLRRRGIAGGVVPSAAPMASRAAMDAVSGAGSVQFSKQLKALKNQASVQAMAEAQAPAGSGGGTDAPPAPRTIGTKTFVMSGKGIWTDTAYDEKAHAKPIQVTFGTEAYFRLITEKPELLPYFSLGEQVIAVLDGRAYQVLPAQPL